MAVQKIMEQIEDIPVDASHFDVLSPNVFFLFVFLHYDTPCVKKKKKDVAHISGCFLSSSGILQS